MLLLQNFPKLRRPRESLHVAPARTGFKFTDMEFAEASLPEQQQLLREALVREEFELYVQPIVALDGRAGWHMAEVLIRLRQEETALVPPGEFLPVFEQLQMMPQLDAWVLRHVVQRHLHGKAGRTFSINVSPQTLAHAPFRRLFGQIIDASGVPAKSVLFEIEESDVVTGVEAAQKFADGIHAVGGGIVIAGFGVHSLPLATVKALAPQYVKIDGSISRRVAHDNSCMFKCQAIRRLGETHDIRVIAECVETPEALQRLKACGIAFAQGYGICRPYPIDSPRGSKPA